ncbi:MAG: hypothetical protein IPM08_10460 [Actinomycetales bacterium]|nr:hypothetical protein [Actinomycetales bacterium]
MPGLGTRRAALRVGAAGTIGATRATLSIPLATRPSGIPSLSTFGVPTT